MPIIESLLDNDFYKFTMGQVVFKSYRDVPVKFALKNRTKGVHLADFISESDLRAELDHVPSLLLNKAELHYVGATNDYSDRLF